MRARLWLNLGLALLLAGLVALALWRPGVEDDTPERLTTLDAASVQRILIERPEAQTHVTLQRVDAERWRVAERDVEANGFLVERILNLAGATSHAQIEAEDRAPFDLARPRLIVHLDGTAIAFGDTEPLAQRRYVEVGGRIHLIEDMVSPLLRGGAEAYVSQRLLPRGAEIAALVLPELSLRRAGAGWEADPPAESHDQIQTLLDEWRYASAYSVQAHEEPTADAPAAVIELQDGQRLTYRLAAREPELILVREGKGLAYRFPSGTAARLFALPEAADAPAQDLFEPEAPGQIPPEPADPPPDAR